MKIKRAGGKVCCEWFAVLHRVTEEGLAKKVPFYQMWVREQLYRYLR